MVLSLLTNKVMKQVMNSSISCVGSYPTNSAVYTTSEFDNDDTSIHPILISSSNDKD